MSLFRRVVVPVASEEDARATALALSTYLHEDSHVLVVHVVPDLPGSPDPAPTSDLLDDAEAMFEAFEEELGGAGGEVTREALHEADVAAAILTTAKEADATAVAFTPRGGSRWVKVLAGDVATSLIAESTVPLVVLPDREGSLEI